MVNTPERPTVQLKLVDTDHLYYSWRWEHELGAIQNIMVPGESVWPVLGELAAALPTPLPGETVDQALERALTGPFMDREREIALTTALAHALIPYQLAQEMNALLEQGLRPHVRLQPSHFTAQVPWEALHVDTNERWVTNCDLSVLPPATVRNAPERRVSEWKPDGDVVAVLDPKVPGAGSALGSVLGPVAEGSPLSSMAERLASRLTPGTAGSAFRRGDLTRDTIEPLLADASRFFYVGHVTTSAHGLDARLHLSCGAGTTGRAAVVAGHRPLTAADIVLGHRPSDPGGWRMPNRVAFIACESGGEVRFAEPVGLVAAALHTGAQFVTATRWTLPTDAGLRRFAPAATPETTVIPETVIAVDAAHDSPDPVAALNRWQRERADRWEAEGRIEDSPIVWAAFGTAFG
jgi:hypothetical protein